MSLNNSTKRSFSNFKDSNASNSIQVSHKNIEFQDPQTITFSKNMSSNSHRKIKSKPSIDLSASSTSLALENFVSYANPASNNSKNLGKVRNNSRGFDNNKFASDQMNSKDREESHRIQTSSEESGNQFDGAIKNQVSQSVQLGNRKAIQSQEGNSYPKETKVGIWGSVKIHQSQALADVDTEAKSHTQTPIKDSQREFSLQNSKVTESEPKDESPEKHKNAKLDFTLGVFTPQKKSNPAEQDILNSLSRKNLAAKSDPNIPKSTSHILHTEASHQEKPTPRKSSRLQAPQLGHRVQTEVEITPQYDEIEAMAKTFKPIHSRNRDVFMPGLKNQNLTKDTRIQNDAYFPQAPKNNERPQKLNRLEEEILNLKNENLRQNEVIEILIDFVKQQKATPSIPLDVSQQANKNLFLGGRQMNYSSNPETKYNDSIPIGPVSNFVEAKLYQQQNQHTVKKQNPNFYKHSLIEQNLDTSKKSQRPPALEESTPSFAPRQFKPYEEGSFSNVYLSPARPISKLPKVHDPTGTQRVYSSPMASFIEKSQAFPSIMGPRVTKSGNADNNTRNIIDMHKKNPSSFRILDPPSEMHVYDSMQLKPTKNLTDNKSRDDGLLKRASENDIKRRPLGHGGASLPLLTTLGKGISEGGRDSLDSLSLEQMKYANDIKKHIRREPGQVDSNTENQPPPQLSDPKAKGKILKEVFSLNWKKKSCV